jgi:cytidyltransferase-like protein
MASIVTSLSMPPLLEEMPISSLSGKRIGYYMGSFDPFHNGHKELISQILMQDKVEYIIVYPVPGEDQYKNRSDWGLRKEMVRIACSVHSRVLCTQLSPAKMQEFLRPLFGASEFVGILGSDVVIEQLSDSDEAHREKVAAVFLRGKEIPAKHANTTIGAIMALPCTSVIISLRNGVDLSQLNDVFGDRPVQCFIQLAFPYSHLSSTKVRECISSGQAINHMVDPSTETLIRANQLYGCQ